MLCRALIILSFLSQAAFSTTPNMGLSLPTVGVTAGPAWATLVNAAFTTIDSHDHTTGKGVQIVPSALNINTNLGFQSNYATALGAATFSALGSSLLGASNYGSVYELVTDLAFLDGGGNTIRLTSGGNLNTAAFGNNSITASKIASGVAATGTPLVANGSGGTSFSSIAFSVSIATKTTNYQLTNADGTILGNASGGLTITLPDPTVNAGKIYFFKNINATGAMNVIPFAAETIDGASSMSLTTQYQSTGVQTDGVNWFKLF